MPDSDEYRPPGPPEAWSRDAVRSEPDTTPAAWGAPAAWAPPALSIASVNHGVSVAAPRRRRRWPWIVGGAIALVGLLVVGGVAAARKTQSSDTANSPTKSVKPTDWDPRIVDLATFVEQHRGLRFKQPVTLDLLDDEAWASDTARSSSPTMNTAAAEALGLFAQGFDGDGARLRATQAAYSGFTSGGESIGVHGTVLDAFTRSQVVHALTHAVVTQNRATVSNIDGAFRSAAAQQRIDYAVFEGDASRVENEWVASLPTNERNEVRARLAAIDAAKNASAPAEFLVEWMLPDLLGDEFVHAISQLGPDERNRLYREPPQDDAGMFDPSRYRDPAPPVITEELEVDEGFAEVAAGTRSVGRWLWFLSLAWADWPAAVRAAMSGYQNDTAIVMRSKSSVCLKAIVVPTSTGVTALVAAFQRWALGDPERTVTLRADGSILVRSCSTDRLSSSVLLDRLAVNVRELSARNQLAAALLEARIETDLRRAVCVAEQTLVTRGAAAVEAAVSPEVGPPLQSELVALVAGSPACAT
jgi:hypothetical protein